MMTQKQILETVMSAVNEHFPVVHVLRGGYPVCGFCLALPERWPQGNTWISFLEPQATQKTTCDDCREALKAEQS